jgi:hypothetical protein
VWCGRGRLLDPDTSRQAASISPLTYTHLVTVLLLYTVLYRVIGARCGCCAILSFPPARNGNVEVQVPVYASIMPERLYSADRLLYYHDKPGLWGSVPPSNLTKETKPGLGSHCRVCIRSLHI